MRESPIDPVSAQSLVDLLRRQAGNLGGRLAYAFLQDGRVEGDGISFSALDAEARALATALQARHQPGERALLLFPAGLDFLKGFFGCLYAGLIAIPAPAPEASRRKRTLPRLQAIARDAEVSLVLSTGETLTLVRETAQELPELGGAEIRDSRETGAPEDWRAPEIASDDVAYLQYTSGSTTDPKGVMLSHANVLHHCRDLRAANGYGPDSVSVTWLPYFHDYGLIEGLLTPLQNGTPCHIMSPFSFLKRPFAWLNAMSALGATNSQAPNFAFDQCVRRIRPDQRAKLDLSKVVSIGNGAEPVNPSVVEAFIDAFGPCGLKPEAVTPAYGLAEATLMMSNRRPNQAPRFEAFDTRALAVRRAVPPAADAEARRITSCGTPLGVIDIAIVDPDTRRRCAADEIGEIWIADACVARGYWRRSEATRETFEARIADDDAGPYLRTGDLGFLHDGELYITSRMKDLVIVAGANHYPQDIEWTVEQAHPAVRPGHVAATSYFPGEEERLLVALEVERGALASAEDAEALLAAVRRSVSEGHEVAVHALVVLRRGSLPKTASGKIRRHACEGFLRALSSEVVAAWTADKGWLVALPAVPADAEGA
jgi:acyl-CoA synthetase (AMP-forming)/AMP-acid ligase II